MNAADVADVCASPWKKSEGDAPAEDADEGETGALARDERQLETGG
jgi:hypothetical protein